MQVEVAPRKVERHATYSTNDERRARSLGKLGLILFPIAGANATRVRDAPAERERVAAGLYIQAVRLLLACLLACSVAVVCTTTQLVLNP
jgi:hypothetical protein